MLGKRERAPFRRTTSMSGINLNLHDGDMVAPPPPPVMAGGDYEHILSPRYLNGMNYVSEESLYVVETPDFLRSCGLCRRRLGSDRDIYMYRGETAFCSLECREQQIKQDERKERSATATMKNGDQSHRSEMAAAAHEATGKTTGAVVAA